LTECLSARLLEYAPQYYDLSAFTDGETKLALQRVYAKKYGKLPKMDKVDSGRSTPNKGSNGQTVERDRKRRKKDKA
jgi:hypothetical protein